MVEAMQELIDEYSARKQPPADPSRPNWTFAGSLFFCLTLMTTIGYGTFAPFTVEGRAAVIAFGFLGIVVTGFVLGVITGAIDSMLDQWHELLLSKRYGKRFLLRFKTLATTLLLLAYWPLLACYASLEMGWRFGESLYFVFETVSTIGLGDLAMRHDSVGEVVLSFLLFVPGLALFTEYCTLGVEYTKAAEEAAEAAGAKARVTVSRKLSSKSFVSRRTSSKTLARSTSGKSSNERLGLPAYRHGTRATVSPYTPATAPEVGTAVTVTHTEVTRLS